MSFDPQAFITDLMNGYVANAKPLEDLLSVKGKVAIVTGGTSGLGFCVTQRLCQGGAKVVMCSHSEEEGERALELFSGRGYDVSFCRCDLRKEEDVANLVAFADAKYGSVDILVTVAAVWGFAHIYDMPEEEFTRVMDININGVFRCVKHVSKYMIEHGIRGKMVLVSSTVAWLTQPLYGGYCHYAASKGAVVSMTIEVAKELKRFGIMVNSVAPGPMLTPGGFTNPVCRSLTEQQAAELNAEMFAPPTCEMVDPNAIATVIYGMCTGMADAMAGETVVADGGFLRNIVLAQPATAAYPPK